MNEEQTFLKCTLIERHQLTHDTFLFVLELPAKSWLRMRTCEHIQLRIPDSSSSSPDTEAVVSRFYTPVPNQLHDPNHKSLTVNQIHLAIKIYPQGRFSRLLNSIPVSGIVETSEPITLSINVDQILCTRQKFFLLAAGTGITPMMSLIWKLKSGRVTKEEPVSVRLLYFNKSIKDIIYQDKLNSLLSSQDRPRFSFELVNVLSEGGDSESGKKGRINKELLREQILDQIGTETEKSFIFVCGPNGFVVSAVK